MQSRNYNPEIPIVIASVCPEAHQALQGVLNQWFDDSHHCIPIDETSDNAKLTGDLTDSDGKWKKNVRCVSAVFDQSVSMGVPACLPSDHQLILFVDDPFKLVFAEYQRKLQQPNFWYRGERIDFSKRFPTLESFLNRHPDWLYDRFPQDLTLANLPQKLSQEYLFVGVLESLQASVNQLANILGQPAVELTDVLDASGAASGFESLRQSFYAQCPRLKAIYDFACGPSGAATEIHHAPHQTRGSNIKTGSLNLQQSQVD